ncbi:SDR family oxidoreductase [Georgenia sp. Z1344]|uniref:SDR family oxidoreductase n=1 Tax=Georgenia sp. Z1344 TaxID=3416706 RepID=UPI003CF59DD9
MDPTTRRTVRRADRPRTVLVTGATGYVGGRLVPELLEAGHRVRALVRTPDKLRDVPWAADIDVRQGDLLHGPPPDEAMDGVEVAYYLVHGMSARGDFQGDELRAARRFARAAEAAGVRRIVYLGGLHPRDEPLSPHLRSRVAVGEVFLASSVPSVVLQAGTIIGSGSASFEMVRHLADVLPLMPAPRWVRNSVQPIAVRDVLHYLVELASVPGDIDRAFDIGGPDALTYADMLNGFAREHGLPRRTIIALPVLTPWLASQWINLVTPIPRDLAVPVVGSLRHSCVVTERDIDAVVPPPDGGLLPYRTAVRLALARTTDRDVPTSWRGATPAGAPSDPLPSDPDWAGERVLTDDRTRTTTASPRTLWPFIEGIGGENGWYSFPLAWAVRGAIDKLAGGAGLRRGRRDAARLHVGDALDFWRVEALEPERLLRLRAEMRMPGRAWLELGVEPDGTGSVYRQRAIYHPRGLSGRLYWLVLVPFHAVIFGGMTERITAAAEAAEEDPRRAGGADGGAGAERDSDAAASEGAGTTAAVRGRAGA